MKIPNPITQDYLKDVFGNGPETEMFGAIFPNGAEWTLENVLKAAEAGFILDCFARGVLPDVIFKWYYDETNAAWRICSRSWRPYKTEFDRAAAPYLLAALRMAEKAEGG